MRLVNWLFGRGKSATPGPYGARGVTALSMLYQGSGRNWQREAGDVWLNSVVGPALSFLSAQASGEPDWRIWVGEREAKGHAFWQIVEGGPMAWEEMVSAAVCSLRIDGNAYFLKLRSNTGALVGIDFVPLGRMTPRRDRDFGGLKADGSNLVTYYRLQTDGRQVDFPVGDVIHVRRGRHPADPAVGFSPLTSVLREIVTDNTAATLNAGLLKRGGIMGLIFSAKTAFDEGDLPAEKIREIEEDLRRKTTGDMAGTSIVTQFPMDVTTVGYSPDQLGVSGLRDSSCSRICSALGIDPMVLGLPSTSKTYANLAEANEAVWRHAVIPDMHAIGDAFTAQCLHQDFAMRGDLRVDLSSVSALMVDIAAKRQMARADYLAGLITADEARVETGRAPMTPAQRTEVAASRRRFAPLTNPKRSPGDPAFHAMVRRHSRNLQSIARKAAKGAISPLDFQDAFMDGLLAMHQESAWYGRMRSQGAAVGYDESVDGALGRTVADGELKYVQGIVDLLEAGGVEPDALANRAVKYTRKARGTANRGFMEDSGESLGIWELGLTEEHCEDCILFHELGEIPMHEFPTSPGLGETVCNVGCDCLIKRTGDEVIGFGNEN